MSGETAQQEYSRAIALWRTLLADAERFRRMAGEAEKEAADTFALAELIRKSHSHIRREV